MRVLISIGFLSFISMGWLGAQTAHYWSQQYGNRSLLLGGAVIGSVDDIGAVYYNPGFLVFQENAESFVITAKVLQFTSVRMDNGLGEDIDLEKNQLGNSSGLVAGTFRLNFLPQSRFAYVALTRHSRTIDLRYRNQQSFDILPMNPGVEDFTSDIVLNLDGTEIWGGIAWSHPLGEHLSMGISNYMAVSHIHSLLNIDLNAQGVDQDVMVLNRIRNYDYLHFGMIFKGGLALKYPKFTAGLVITPPKINIFGRGYMYTKTVVAGTQTGYVNFEEDFYESGYQQDIPVVLKSPWAIGAGAGYALQKFSFHLSTEWFSKVDKYTVMEPEVFIGQSSGEAVINRVVDELYMVINAGLGIKYQLNENYDLYMGFSTDFSAASPDSKTFADLESEIYNSSNQANFYHFSGGTVFNLNRLHITLGLAYNYGIDYLEPPVELPDSQVLSENESSPTSLKISNWRLLLGFAIDPDRGK